MRLEDMKKDIPETPEFIHTMIQSEVKKQLQDTKVVNIQTRRVKKWTGASVAAAIQQMQDAQIATKGLN